MTYPITISNGYTIIDIAGQKFLLDTGSRRSISAVNGLFVITIEEREFGLLLYPLLADQLKTATGLPVVGIIASDVLNAFGGIECDLENGTATFGSTEEKEGIVVPFEEPNDYHFHVKVNGKEALGLFDVGAPKPMIDNHALLDETLYEGQVDEPSTTGNIETAQYGGTLEFGGVTRTVHMLKSVRDMMRDGISDLYFGISSFAEKYYAIDLMRQEIRFL